MPNQKSPIVRSSLRVLVIILMWADTTSEMDTDEFEGSSDDGWE